MNEEFLEKSYFIANNNKNEIKQGLSIFEIKVFISLYFLQVLQDYEEIS